MRDEEKSKLTLKQLSVLTRTKFGEFTVFGWKCRRSDDVLGWVLISETNEDDRRDYWVTGGRFYLIPGRTVAVSLYSGGASIFECSESAAAPETSRKEAMSTAISTWESHPDLYIQREGTAAQAV
jgi:hypothetical protein